MSVVLRIRFSTEIKDLKANITSIQPELLTPAWIRGLIRDTLEKRNADSESAKKHPVDVPIKLIRMGKVLRGKQYGKFVDEVVHYQQLARDNLLSEDKQFYLNAMMGSPEDFAGVEAEIKKDQLNRSGLEWFKNLTGTVRKRKHNRAGLSVTHGNVMINIPGAFSSETGRRNGDNTAEEDNERDHNGGDNYDDYDDYDDDDDEDDSREGQNVHVQGLDRLVDMGFSQQEIQDLREQFRQRMRYESGDMLIPDEYLDGEDESHDLDRGTGLRRHISEDGFLDLENGPLLNRKLKQEDVNEEEDFQFTDEEILSCIRQENILQAVSAQDVGLENPQPNFHPNFQPTQSSSQSNPQSSSQSNFQPNFQPTQSSFQSNFQPNFQPTQSSFQPNSQPTQPTHRLTEQERLLQLEEQFFQSVQEDMNTDISGIHRITSLKLNLEILLGVLLGLSLGFGNFFVFIFIDGRMMSPTLERTIIVSLITSFFVGFNRG